MKKEMELLDRILEERKDECFDEEGKKQKKEDEKKIVGKMINPSDPDASWGAKSDKKFFAGYKVESNLDHKYGIITAIEADKAGHPEEKSAAPLLEQQKENLGIVPLHFTADAKYDFGNTRTELKALGVSNLYIPLVPTKNKERGLVWDNFYFECGHLFCPAGYPAERRFEEYELVMKGERYKIEPRQADLKNNHGLKRARYRGLSRVRIQAYLAAMASNLKKWFKKIMGALKDGTLKTLSLLAALAPPKGGVCPDDG
ncbi:transposase [Candidatus Saganbacteria bacterium]|nr:transposase [Candidatus Saganbacteria bacterium]